MVYQDGKWSKAPGPEHNYMGFSATRKRFYSSGHPAAGAGLTDPFGLIRSDDGGKMWKTLDLEGDSDFHLLATNAVCVFNHEPNSRMKSAGLHRTVYYGLMWKKAAGRDEYAIATFKRSAFVRRDGGNNWEPIARRGQGLGRGGPPRGYP